MDKEKKVNCSTGKVVLAFLTGAGIATSAFLVAKKAREVVTPSAERLLKKCDRAFEALDNQITQKLAV